MASKVWPSSSSGLTSKRDSYSIASVPPSPLTDHDDDDDDDRSRQSWRESSPEEYDVANSPSDFYYPQDPIAGRTSAHGKGKARQFNDDQNVDAQSPTPLDQAFNPDLISLEPLDDDEVETRRVEDVRRTFLSSSYISEFFRLSRTLFSPVSSLHLTALTSH
jgi:hypothetical protein